MWGSTERDMEDNRKKEAAKDMQKNLTDVRSRCTECGKEGV